MTIEAVAPLTFSVTTEQDVSAISCGFYHALYVANLTTGQDFGSASFLTFIIILNIPSGCSTNSFIVELEVLQDVGLSTVDEEVVGSNILSCIALEPCLQFFRSCTFVREFGAPFLVFFILCNGACDYFLQVNQLVLESHQVRSIACGLHFSVLSSKLISVALVCRRFQRIIVNELSDKVLTILFKVTLVVEGELVHLHTAVVVNLNLEVSVRNCTADREVDVALEEASGLEDVSAYVFLLVDEYPTVSVLDSVIVAIEVGSPNLPVLPVTVCIFVCVATSNEAVVGGLDGRVVLCLEDDEAVARSCSTPLGAIAVTINQRCRTL